MAAEQITSAPQAQASTVKVQATEVVKQFRPELTNGDIIKLLVRSVANNNQGVLYYRGLLIPALLPDNLNPGDTIQAKVGLSGDQMRLQILETVTKAENSLLTTLGKIPQLTTQISNELNQLLKEIKLSLSQATLPSQTSQPSQLSQPFTTNQQQPTQVVSTNIGADTPDATLAPKSNPLIPIEQLFVATLPEETPLIQGDQILAQLKKISDPVVLERIKQSIVQFKENLGNVDLKAADGTAKNLAKLIILLKNVIEDDSLVPDQIKKIVQSVVDESKKLPVKLTPRGSIQNEITPDLAKAITGDKEALRSIVAKTERFIETVSDGIKLAQGSMHQLHQFEQLIDSQQRLLTLNPLMHTLGEPAFILFPFIVQGLLKHSEVTISPPSPDKVDEDEENGEKAKRYQRVSVTVPLTNLGNVVVDVAHCPGEVLIRFSVRDNEVKDILGKRIGELEQALAARGFGGLEYWISVNGDNQSPNGIFSSPLFLSTTERSGI